MAAFNAGGGIARDTHALALTTSTLPITHRATLFPLLRPPPCAAVGGRRGIYDQSAFV
jgi:hypothetical protein